MSGSCTLAAHRTNGGYLIRVVGRGTVKESRMLRDFVQPVLKSGAPVVLDLNECTYLDSTFLGCVVILHQQAKTQTGSFAVWAEPRVQDQLLKPCQLHQLLTFVNPLPTGISRPVVLPSVAADDAEFCQHLLEAHRALSELGGPAADTFRRIADEMARDLGQKKPLDG